VTHSHRATPSGAVHVGGRVRTILLVALAAAAVATVVALVSLWPDRSAVDAVRKDVQFTAPNVTTPDATVLDVAPACPVTHGGRSAQSGQSSGQSPTCGRITVKVLDGAGKGDRADVQVPPEVTSSGLASGDRVELVRMPATNGQPAAYTFNTVRRGTPLLWLAIVFAFVVLLVARWRGLMAMVGLAFSGVVIYWFLLPSLLVGESGIGVAAVSASAIMFVVLYSTHGLSLRTSTALAGTLLGIGVTALVGLVAIDQARLTGISDESGGTLSAFTGNLDFQGLLACSVILAGLGVLNDVTITQASAVWELRAASPTMSRRGVFASAMRIGRDHIASTIYTIVFAYAGAALVVLMLLFIYDRPLLDLVSSESLAEEIARTLTSAIGLILAVPITTAIAALIAAPEHATAAEGDL
jgi:uncharacterized membrane protein